MHEKKTTELVRLLKLQIEIMTALTAAHGQTPPTKSELQQTMRSMRKRSDPAWMKKFDAIVIDALSREISETEAARQCVALAEQFPEMTDYLDLTAGDETPDFRTRARRNPRKKERGR